MAGWGQHTKTRTHGHSGGALLGPRTPTYRSWNSMKQRCLNPNHIRYAQYGGRGITVCEKWLTFEGFLADVGERPSAEHCLSRIDHDKGYEPGNVEWALKRANNKDAAIRRWH